MSDPNQEEVKSMIILSYAQLHKEKSFSQGYIKKEGYFINKMISSLSHNSQNHKNRKIYESLFSTYLSSEYLPSIW